MKPPRRRLEPEDRKRQILVAAVKLAEIYGYTNVTREAIAALAECAPGLVSAYFGTMLRMYRAIMGEAIKTENLPIIAQGLVLGDTRARKAPEDVKRRAAMSLLGQSDV